MKRFIWTPAIALTLLLMLVPFGHAQIIYEFSVSFTSEEVLEGHELGFVDNDFSGYFSYDPSAVYLSQSGVYLCDSGQGQSLASCDLLGSIGVSSTQNFTLLARDNSLQLGVWTGPTGGLLDPHPECYLELTLTEDVDPTRTITLSK